MWIWLQISTAMFWISSSMGALKSAKALPRLLDLPMPPSHAILPKLSIIIAALNEEETIGPALKTILELDYPDLEIIAVNDRSTDKTPQIIAELANKDPRLKLVTIETLPHGWLGKVNALETGRKLASGKWLLFTDADIHFAPSALKTAIHYVEQYSFDHLGILPSIKASSFWLAVTVAYFAHSLLGGLPFWRIGEPESKFTFGIGAFNLVRASLLEKSGGFEWLKMEVADDPALGFHLLNHGGKPKILIGKDMVWVDWYPSLKDMFKGLEKNTFAATGYSYFVVLIFILFHATVLFVTLSAFVSTPHTFLSWIVIGTVVFGIFSAISLGKKTGARWQTCSMLPIGLLIFNLMVLRSAFLCWKQGGIKWRGTHYSINSLREGQRLRVATMLKIGLHESMIEIKNFWHKLKQRRKS